MMATEQQIAEFLMRPNLTDAQIVSELNRIGATAQQVSNVTGIPVADVQSRIGAVIEPQVAEFLMRPNLTDAQIVAELNRIGASPQQVSNVTGIPVADVQSRISAVASQQVKTPVPTPAPTPVPTPVPTPAPTRVPTPVPTPAPTPVPTPQITKQTQFQNFLMQPNLTDAQIAAEMIRLGITTGQASNLTGLPESNVNSRFNTVAPFANALPATFAQNFQNYTSIPIGAQYNPGVTAGGVTPYSQVMGQMRPFANPYAGVIAGQSMGGYDPSIYDPNLFSNFVKERADKAAADAAATAAQQTAMDYGGFDGA
jgi:hypothetical protein